jgi:SOS-response transcriptional repressor LexA
MGWATRYIADVQRGQTVTFRPTGNSMTGIINSGDLVTVVPVKIEDVKPGDVVLCKVKGKEYLHLVKAKGSDGRVQIGNNRGNINGWTSAVYGKCTKVEA